MKTFFLVVFLVTSFSSLFGITAHSMALSCEDLPMSNAERMDLFGIAKLELRTFIKKHSPDDYSSFDYLKSDRQDIMTSLLASSPKIINNLFLKLMHFERVGISYDYPGSLEFLLRHLLELSRSKIEHNKIKYQFEAQCLMGVCVPRIIEDYIISINSSPISQLYLEYPVVVKIWGRLFLLYERRELEVDLGTGALRTQNLTGKTYMDLLIEALGKQADSITSTFIFIDLNNLGLVNYFAAGQEAGDRYIEAFGKVIKDNLRKQDQFFRTGGDEFVILATDLNKIEVSDLMRKIVDDFATSPEAMLVFESQWQFYKTAIGEIAEMRSFLQLENSSAIGILDEQWVNLAKIDWATFIFNYKITYQAELFKKLERQAYILQPSISIGSKVITNKDNFSRLNSMASCQAGLCKRLYKEAQGADASKYGGMPANQVLQDTNIESQKQIRPEVFLPMVD
jgi:diguanylate cyclase (GGDEF)-like protein